MPRETARGSRKGASDSDLSKCVSEGKKKGIKLITDIINAIITTEIYNKNVNLKWSQSEERRAKAVVRKTTNKRQVEL